MILQQLTLRNFGVYAGEQLFDLSPARRRGRAAPIILFGGINGGGKTTILDAIQLVLYGNRARCSKRGAKPYDEFLAASINHGTAPGDGAAVGLAFRFAAEGEEHLYDVTRAWSVSRGRLQERVEVTKDGEPDGWLSDNWHQVVEELIPFGIAQLCFFDAEKIRFLAEDETSSEALGVAIKSVLGLDLAERLIADASSLEGRLAKRIRKSPDLLEAERLETALAAKQAEIEALHQEKASLENPRQLAVRLLQRAEEQFAKVGGKLWTEREEQQRRRGELEFQCRECEERLVALAASELPLALVGDLMNSAATQARTEHAARETEIIGRLLATRDDEVLALLKEQKVKAAAIRQPQKLPHRLLCPLEKAADPAVLLRPNPTQRKIDRLSELVSDAFRYLLRKKTLVRRVVIDPASFAITLVGDEGRFVSKDRLSEGEKQIFAISVLWGLSRASARPFPAIIDTPMARLDVEHRNQIVERYFPNASHQVIILSTDTEIERNYFDQLRGSVARAYLLNYDEATRSTVPVEGYFWDSEPTSRPEEVAV